MSLLCVLSAAPRNAQGKARNQQRKAHDEYDVQRACAATALPARLTDAAVDGEMAGRPFDE